MFTFIHANSHDKHSRWPACRTMGCAVRNQGVFSTHPAVALCSAFPKEPGRPCCSVSGNPISGYFPLLMKGKAPSVRVGGPSDPMLTGERTSTKTHSPGAHVTQHFPGNLMMFDIGMSLSFGRHHDAPPRINVLHLSRISGLE